MAKDFQKGVNDKYALLEIELDHIFQRLLLHAKRKYAAITMTDKIHEYLRDLSVKMRACAIPAHKYTIYIQLGKDPKDYPNSNSMASVQVALKVISKGKPVRAKDVMSFTRDEVLAKDSGLMPNIHWYLHKQILPPMERLCAPISVTDVTLLAECPGYEYFGQWKLPITLEHFIEETKEGSQRNSNLTQNKHLNTPGYKNPRDVGEVNNRMKHIRGVLKKHHDVLRNEINERYVEPAIWDSILLLASTLCRAVDILLRPLTDIHDQDHQFINYRDLYLRSVFDFRNNKMWCPHERKIVAALVGDQLLDLAFFSQLDRFESFVTHDKCDAGRCVAYQVMDSSVYKTRHVTESCSYKFIGLNKDEMPSESESEQEGLEENLTEYAVDNDAESCTEGELEALGIDGLVFRKKSIDDALIDKSEVGGDEELGPASDIDGKPFSVAQDKDSIKTIDDSEADEGVEERVDDVREIVNQDDEGIAAWERGAQDETVEQPEQGTGLGYISERLWSFARTSMKSPITKSDAKQKAGLEVDSKDSENPGNKNEVKLYENSKLTVQNLSGMVAKRMEGKDVDRVTVPNVQDETKGAGAIEREERLMKQKSMKIAALRDIEWVYKSASKLLVLNRGLHSVVATKPKAVDAAGRMYSGSYTLSIPGGDRLMAETASGDPQQIEIEQLQKHSKLPKTSKVRKAQHLSVFRVKEFDPKVYLSGTSTEINITVVKFGMPLKEAYFNIDKRLFKIVNQPWHSIRMFLEELTLEWTGGAQGLALARCMRGMYYRNCSKQEDEPLVLASMLSWQPGSAAKLTECAAPDRYKTLFQGLKYVPQDILFIDHPRYKAPGARWIPTSLLTVNMTFGKPISRTESEPIPTFAITNMFRAHEKTTLLRVTKVGLQTTIFCRRLSPQGDTVKAPFQVDLSPNGQYQVTLHHPGIDINIHEIDESKNLALVTGSEQTAMLLRVRGTDALHGSLKTYTAAVLKTRLVADFVSLVRITSTATAEFDASDMPEIQVEKWKTFSNFRSQTAEEGVCYNPAAYMNGSLYERLDNSKCISAYGTSYVSDRVNVLAITSARTDIANQIAFYVAEVFVPPDYFIVSNGLGFGTVHSRVTIMDSLPSSNSAGLAAAVLAANLPQVIYSLLYFAYNALLTSMLLSYEYSQYDAGVGLKALRVSSPKG
ncbi:hypothetical protein B0A48_18522 [Cryoendolithus antarcticus]|uniref:DNA-directed DNA polymerase n=1 Tax=Cryoendolithus antarcticus TaxID=1507870 RepID=A0A1V8S9B9_9PEZI|nr:hypothetical protein B0A48_18522 [Cryoendolithus antarcticus]